MTWYALGRAYMKQKFETEQHQQQQQQQQQQK